MREPQEQPVVQEVHPMYLWRATLLKIERRNAIILMNESNQYTVVLFGMKAKQFNSFNDTITEAIRSALVEENLSQDVIDAYFSKANNITLIHDEEDMKLERACDHAKVVLRERQLIAPSIHQFEITQTLNRLAVENDEGEYIYPNEELYADVEQLVDGSIFNPEAVIL